MTRAILPGGHTMPTRAGAVRVAGAGAAVLAAPVAAAAVSLAYQRLVRGLALRPGTEEPRVLLSSVILLGAAALAAFAWGRRPGAAPRSGRATTLVCGVLVVPVLGGAVQVWQLRDTAFYLNGLNGDQLLRTVYLARFTDSAALADPVYPDLPPYYPPGWFWLGGRLGDLLGQPAWSWYQQWSIATMSAATALAFVLWLRVVVARRALLAAGATAFVGIAIGAYEPYSWIITASLPPLLVLAARALYRRRNAPPTTPYGAGVAVGVAAGTALLVYPLLAGPLAIALTVLGVAAVRHGTRVATVVRAAAFSAAIAAALGAFTWVPYLRADAPLGIDSYAAWFLPDIGARPPTPMFAPTVWGLLYALGLGWIVLRTSRSRVALALGAAVATGYLWYGLSFVAVAAGTSLLAFRLEPLIELALLLGGVFALADLAVLARRRLRHPGSAWHPSAARRVAVGATLAGALLLVHAADHLGGIDKDLAAAARTQPGPDGTVAASRIPAYRAPGVSADELAAHIGALTGCRPPRDITIITPGRDLAAFVPYREFQTSSPAYANPKAGYDTRLDLLLRWARARDGAALAAALDASPVRAPEVFILEVSGQGGDERWTLDLLRAREPHGGFVHETAVFDPAVFDDAHFAVKRLDRLVIAARR